MPAFETPGQVTSGLGMSAAAIASVGQGLLVGGLQAAIAHRAAQADAAALGAWDAELRRARGNVDALGRIATQAVHALVEAEDEVDALRREVADLRRSVAQRESLIRALSV